MSAELAVAVIGAVATLASTALTVAVGRQDARRSTAVAVPSALGGSMPGGSMPGPVMPGGSPVAAGARPNVAGRVLGTIVVFGLSVFAMYVLATSIFSMVYSKADVIVGTVAVMSLVAWVVLGYLSRTLLRPVGRPFPGRGGLLFLVAVLAYGTIVAFVATSYVT